MAAVNLAACKIAGMLFGLERWQTLALVGGLNVVFAAQTGLWGVLVIDMIQFFIKMSAVIAAAYFAVKAPQVGGLDGLMHEALGDARPRRAQLPEHAARLPQQLGSGGRGVHHADRGPVVGGLVSGSRARRRQLHRAAHAGVASPRSDALGAVLFFNVAHYVLRPWPWILVALCVAHRLSESLGHPGGVSAPRPAGCSATTSRIRRC